MPGHRTRTRWTSGPRASGGRRPARTRREATRSAGAATWRGWQPAVLHAEGPWCARPPAGRAALRASWRRGRRVWWLLRKVCAGRVHPPELLRSARCLHRRLGRVRARKSCQCQVQGQLRALSVAPARWAKIRQIRASVLGRTWSSSRSGAAVAEGAQRPCTAEPYCGPVRAAAACAKHRSGHQYG